QHPRREVRVRVDEFRVRNQTKTSNARQAAADQIPLSMVNDPAPIRDLADRLEDLTIAVAKAPSRNNLPENLPVNWPLTADTCATLKAATDTAAKRGQLNQQIAQA